VHGALGLSPAPHKPSKVASDCNPNSHLPVSADATYQERLFSHLDHTVYERNESVKKAVDSILRNVEGNNRLKILSSAIKNKFPFHSQAHNAANNSINSPDDAEQTLATKIFKTLLQEGKALDEVINHAQNNIDSNNLKKQENALKLYTMLVKNGKAYNKAIIATTMVEKNIENYSYWSNRYYKFYLDLYLLYIALVNQEQAYSQAIEAAKKGVKNKDFRSVSPLYIALVNQEQAYSQAIEAAQEGIKSSFPSMVKGALKLYAALAKQGQALDEAKKAFSNAKEDPALKDSEEVKELAAALSKDTEISTLKSTLEYLKLKLIQLVEAFKK